MQEEKRYVQVEEIASILSVPKHFMGKILKELAKQNLLSSAKGPSGGFAITEKTLMISLMEIIAVTDGIQTFDTCVLSIKDCSATNPCPMHNQMESVKKRMKEILLGNTIRDLLNNNKTGLLKSICSTTEPVPVFE